VALAGGLDQDDQLPPQTRQRALLVRIQAFIEQRLGDPPPMAQVLVGWKIVVTL
jgi:hypothetical protein